MYLTFNILIFMRNLALESYILMAFEDTVHGTSIESMQIFCNCPYLHLQVIYIPEELFFSVLTPLDLCLQVLYLNVFVQSCLLLWKHGLWFSFDLFWTEIDVWPKIQLVFQV